MLCLVVGAIVSIGAWPYGDPSPYGALFKWFAGDTAAGLALRNTPRACPWWSWASPASSLPASARGPPLGSWWPPVLWAFALVALAPVLADGFLSRNLDRPEDVPQYWKDAIAALTPAGTSTRILEIPGIRLLGLPLGRHHRADHARADRSALRRARDPAVGLGRPR